MYVSVSRPENLALPRQNLWNNLAVGVADLDGSKIELLEFRLDLGAVADADQNHLARVQILLGNCFRVSRGDGGEALGQFFIIVRREIVQEDVR